MNSIFSPQGGGVVTVSSELRTLIKSAYELKGKSIEIPINEVKKSCAGLSAKTTQKILEIRRQERTISPQTLAIRFD